MSAHLYYPKRPVPENLTKIENRCSCLKAKLLNGILATVKFSSNDSDSSEHCEAAIVDLTLLNWGNQKRQKYQYVFSKKSFTASQPILLMYLKLCVPLFEMVKLCETESNQILLESKLTSH